MGRKWTHESHGKRFFVGYRTGPPGRAPSGDSHLGGGPSQRATWRAHVVRCDEIGNARHDLGGEARAVEYAVVPDRELQIVRLLFRRNVDAQAMRRFGLSNAGDVV